MKFNCYVCQNPIDKKPSHYAGLSSCKPCRSEMLSVKSKVAHYVRYEEFIGRWKSGQELGMKGKTSTSAHIKKYLFLRCDNKCERCGWNETNPKTGRVPLEIEHIDGDFKNNSEKNLALICPNCHSLTNTYRSLNKGRGRPR